MEYKTTEKQFLALPPQTKVYETDLSWHWMGENGVFYGITKPVEWTLERCQQVLNLYSKIGNGNKLIILVDATNTLPMSQEVQHFYTRELPHHVKASAVLMPVASVMKLAGAFMKLSFSGFSTRLFSNEADALEWISSLDEY